MLEKFYSFPLPLATGVRNLNSLLRKLNVQATPSGCNGFLSSDEKLKQVIRGALASPLYLPLPLHAYFLLEGSEMGFSLARNMQTPELDKEVERSLPRPF